MYYFNKERMEEGERGAERFAVNTKQVNLNQTGNHHTNMLASQPYTYAIFNLISSLSIHPVCAKFTQNTLVGGSL